MKDDEINERAEPGESDRFQIVGPHHNLELEHRPERLQVVVTLEIPVKDMDGTYLIVTYPDYAGADVIDTAEDAELPVEPGQWTPPYITYDVEDGGLFSRTRKTEKLFKRFEQIDDATVERDLRRYTDRLGLNYLEFESLDTFYEFRLSFRYPGSFRGYQIRRVLGRVEDDDMMNIADSEMRKGFAFLPIDERFVGLTNRHCDRHHRHERLFMGKPIASNLRSVLEDERLRGALSDSAVAIDPEAFFTSQNGFIFAGDLAGYGRFCQFLADNTGDLDRTGDAGAQEFRDLAIRLFTKLFHSADIRHTHTAGDGFICALPESELPSHQAQLQSALSAHLEMTKKLDGFNEKAKVFAQKRNLGQPPRLGSRLAVHHGDYRFGKMSMLASLLPTLDGASVIEAARIEAGLRSWVYSTDRPDQHWIAVSQKATQQLSGLELSDLSSYGPFEPKQGVEVAEKEFAGSVELWQVS